MPYTKFRAIAYEVLTATMPTATRDFAETISGWSPGVECAAIARLPVKDVANDDARIRLKRLASIVDLAQTQVVAHGDSADTLKVFVVPEFYFRPESSGQGYDYHTYPNDVALQIFTALDTLFKHDDFRHWLFVCGTVLWNNTTWNAGGKIPRLYLNTAVHVWGGVGRPGAAFVEKKLPSNVDGVPIAFAPGVSKDVDVKLVFESWSVRKKQVANIETVFYGLEVCRDHTDDKSCRVLKNVLADWPANNNMAIREVKLHVVTAGGVALEPKSVAAKVGGYVFRNDGYPWSNRHSNLRRVERYLVDYPMVGAPADLSDYESYADLGAEENPEWAVAVPVGAQSVPVPNGYVPLPQRIAFYKALPL